MTKKHFEMIAEILAMYNASMGSIDYKITGKDLMREISFTFAHRLHKENDRFDRDRFLLASGIKD